MTPRRLFASMLISRDGLEDLPVDLTGYVEPGSRAKDGSCVVVVESAAWDCHVHGFAPWGLPELIPGQPVTLTAAEERDAEAALLRTIES